MIHAREDYNKGKMDEIPEDEPVFLLRAQDATAAKVVRFWASLQPIEESEELIRSALEHADLMDAWPVKKIADL